MSCLTPGATRTDTLLPYTTLFRSDGAGFPNARSGRHARAGARGAAHRAGVKGPHRLEEPLTIGSVLLPREFPGRERGGLVCRSEEHTSELQSLMRISYAVFCLKKNKCR